MEATSTKKQYNTVLSQAKKGRKEYRGLHLRTVNLLRKQHLPKAAKGLSLITAAALLTSPFTLAVCRTTLAWMRSMLICTA